MEKLYTSLFLLLQLNTQVKKLACGLVFFLFLSIYGFTQATLPVNRTTWDVEPPGWTNDNASYTSADLCSDNNQSYFYLATYTSRTVNYNASASQLVFKIMVGNGSMGIGYFTISQSANGTTYTEIGKYGPNNIPF